MYGGQNAKSEVSAAGEGDHQDQSGDTDGEMKGEETLSQEGLDDAQESEDDTVSLTNESVSFTRRAGGSFGRGSNFSMVSNNVEQDNNSRGNDERTVMSPKEANNNAANKHSDDIVVGGSRGLVVDTKRAQSRRSRGSSSSSNATNKTAVDQDEQEEPVTPKSVTFAEQLITEEISFDPSSPHLDDWNGEINIGEAMGSTKSQDTVGVESNNFDSWRQHDDVLEVCKKTVNSLGLDRRDGPPAVQSADNDESYESGLTASQLRERFEKMNTDGQAKRPIPLPASRRSLIGWQQQGMKNTVSPLTSSSYSWNNTNGTNNNFAVNNYGLSSTKPQKPGNGVVNTTAALSPTDVSGSQPAENLALRVLADVATQRAAVERMQMHSIIQSQDAGRKLREEQQQQQQQKHPVPVPTQRQRRLSTSSQNSSLALSRDSPSSLSISSDINDSLVGPVGTVLPRAEKNDGGEGNMPNRGSQPHCVDKSFSFETSNISNAQNVTLSGRMAQAPRQNTQTAANISHMSFPDNNGSNPLVISQSSPSVASTKTPTMNITPSSGMKGNFHSSHNNQQNTKVANRFGPPVSSRVSVQSAQSVLFPQGGRPIPPVSRPTSVSSSGFSIHSSTSPRTHISQTTIGASNVGDVQHLGVGGSGENSISSDNSEGAESNLQSSASSGYHSEHSGLLRGIGMSSTISGSSGVSGRAGRGIGSNPLTHTQLPNEDRDLYTQEFVNRAPSFTFSSGSSSPYSRASNDEMAYPNGPDVGNISNNKHSGFGITPTFQKYSLDNKNSALTDVTFPNQTSPQLNHLSLNPGVSKYPVFHNTNDLHNILSNEKQIAMYQEKSSSLRQPPKIPGENTSVAKSSFPFKKGDVDGGSNSSLSSSSSSQPRNSSSAPLLLPPTPLVRTNALGPSPHSRPESSNSLSSQYSTSSSTLSAIYRPFQQQQPQQQHQQKLKGEPRADEKGVNASGVTPLRGQSQSGKVAPKSTTSHSAQLDYQGISAKPNSQSKSFQPTGQKEEAWADNLRQLQSIRPYRPISMNSNIGGHTNNRRSGDFVGSRQPSRGFAGPDSYSGQSYNRVMPTPAGDFKQSSSGNFGGARETSKENRISYPQPMQHYTNNKGAQPTSSYQDSTSDSFTEDHEDYRAKLADTQRNMFSKMQHPKLTHLGNAEGRQDLQRNSNYSYNATPRGNNSRSIPEKEPRVTTPSAQQPANQAPPVSSNQQTFQDPRGSVPLVLRSSKC